MKVKFKYFLLLEKKKMDNKDKKPLFQWGRPFMLTHTLKLRYYAAIRQLQIAQIRHLVFYVVSFELEKLSKLISENELFCTLTKLLIDHKHAKKPAIFWKFPLTCN